MIVSSSDRLEQAANKEFVTLLLLSGLVISSFWWHISGTLWLMELHIQIDLRLCHGSRVSINKMKNFQ